MSSDQTPASYPNKMEKSERELKHLGFVRVTAINALVLLSDLYSYAKQSSGPLKSTVGTVEKAVTTVVGPVYERFKGVPEDVLVFLDKKVDEVTEKFDEHAPPLAKKFVGKAQIVVHKASQVAQDLFQEAQVGGSRAAIHHATTLSKQFAVSQLAVLWYQVNRCPPLHGFAEMAVPTAAHWSDKYNKCVIELTSKGYGIFSYFPLVPVEDLAKAYKQVEAGASKKEDGSSKSSSESETD